MRWQRDKGDVRTERPSYDGLHWGNAEVGNSPGHEPVARSRQPDNKQPLSATPERFSPRPQIGAATLEADGWTQPHSRHHANSAQHFADRIVWPRRVRRWSSWNEPV